MMLPTKARQKSSQLFPDNPDRQRAFLMGVAFQLGCSLDDFMVEEPTQESYPLQKALDTWCAYKKERKQAYKPRGLAMVKKRLMQMSNGNPDYAMQIVEFSISNNYAGLFTPKPTNINNYEQQKRTLDKVSAILAR